MLWLSLKTNSTVLSLVFAVYLSCSTSVYAIESGSIINAQLADCQKTHSQNCYDSIEKMGFLNAGNVVSRNGEMLTISTEHKKLTFKNRIGDIPIHYLYAGYYKEIGYHLLQVIYYDEDVSFLMISQRSGVQMVLWEVPHVSPSHDRLVSMSQNEASSTPNDITVWRISPEKLTTEFTYRANKYALYKFLLWSEDTTIRFEKIEWGTDKTCPVDKLETIPQILKLSNNTWRIGTDSTRKTKCE